MTSSGITTTHDRILLHDKTAIVTGATSGIGLAIAEMLAENKVKVVLCGRHEDKLKAALEIICTPARQVHGVIADISRPEDVKRLFQAADDQFGGVDFLINNAGIGGASVLHDDSRWWREVVMTNVIGYIDCAAEAIPRLRARGGGHIINIGSMSAQYTESDNDVYAATKAAVRAFTRSLSKGVNRDDIKVSVIEPGQVATEIFDLSDDAKNTRVERLEMLKSEDIAGLVYTLLSQPKRSDIVFAQIRPFRQL